MLQRIFICLFLCLSVIASSQTEKQRQLESKRNQILKLIDDLNTLLKSEENKEKDILQQLEEQQLKIRLTEDLIKTSQNQERLISEEITTNEKQIKQLSTELETIKADYAQMIVKSYESRSQQSRIMFILSSDNFLQAYKRIQYMKQYAELRREQGIVVQEKSRVLAEKNQTLQQQKQQKEKLLQQATEELKIIEKEKEKQDALMAVINDKKTKYTAEITKKQKEITKINQQIDKVKRDIIAEANRKKANADAKAAGKKSSEKKVSSTTIDLSPESKIIAGNFKANKGKLPWPVERGVVYLRYGVHPHPIEKQLSYDNKGIDFKTNEGADALAVFEGEVSEIMAPSPANMFVFVRHGDYITVYGNLDKIYVKKGQKVKLKQPLGRIHTYLNGNTTMKFTISHNIETLNPEQWLNGF